MAVVGMITVGAITLADKKVAAKDKKKDEKAQENRMIEV